MPVGSGGQPLCVSHTCSLDGHRVEGATATRLRDFLDTGLYGTNVYKRGDGVPLHGWAVTHQGIHAKGQLSFHGMWETHPFGNCQY